VGRESSHRLAEPEAVARVVERADGDLIEARARVTCELARVAARDDDGGREITRDVVEVTSLTSRKKN
jgi:hypothetical protein